MKKSVSTESLQRRKGQNTRSVKCVHSSRTYSMFDRFLHPPVFPSSYLSFLLSSIPSVPPSSTPSASLHTPRLPPPSLPSLLYPLFSPSLLAPSPPSPSFPPPPPPLSLAETQLASPDTKTSPVVMATSV